MAKHGSLSDHTLHTLALLDKPEPDLPAGLLALRRAFLAAWQHTQALEEVYLCELDRYYQTHPEAGNPVQSLAQARRRMLTPVIAERQAVEQAVTQHQRMRDAAVALLQPVTTALKEDP